MRALAIAMMPRNQTLKVSLICLLLALSALVYLPGVSGPFVFDDYSNVLHNDFVKIENLDVDSLSHAAYSLEAGPLQRPIAMISFALNYYFAQSFADPTPFKLTNLVIHIINGCLLFWLISLVFARAAELRAGHTIRPETAMLWAGATALLWIVHPIQLTSVLYLVQRMAQLSALFSILALICYLKGRLRFLGGHRDGIWIMTFGLVGCGTLGVLSKENAVLLPIFVAALEFTLFANEWPWRLWSGLSTPAKRALIVGSATVVIVASIAVLAHALPGYGHRPFSLTERIMTEGRVLLFYLSLILLPRISAFGLYHDDIALSTSLLDPWTTLPAMLAIVALLALAVTLRRSQPLLSLGILWFFIGHLVESTVIALEIAHEHRNYLASVGPLLVTVYLIASAVSRLKMPRLWVMVPVIALAFALTTFQRAEQWSDLNMMYRYDALHHPRSARSQGSLGWLLLKQGHNEEAMEAMRQAARLDPREPGYMVSLQFAAARMGNTLTAEERQEILGRLKKAGITALTMSMLQYTAKCLPTTCTAMQAPMEQWLRFLITERALQDLSFAYNLLGRTLMAQGRTEEAVDAFHRAYEADPIYLHPLFELANLYISSGQTENATRILAELRKANRRSLHPRDREIELVASAIEVLRTKNRDHADDAR